AQRPPIAAPNNSETLPQRPRGGASVLRELLKSLPGALCRPASSFRIVVARPVRYCRHVTSEILIIICKFSESQDRSHKGVMYVCTPVERARGTPAFAAQR